jgi:pimeloyl-ACP methyl ester carboxylesterase
MTAAPEIIERFITAEDGLRLHLRDFNPHEHADNPASRLPVLCLPGLTRTAADFDDLATVLATDPARPRRVLAMNLRGRGLSDRDPNAANYNVLTEARDVATALDKLGIARTILVGSSRGGLVALTLPALNPALLAGIVFNDIGPVIEMGGLVRIAGYAGKIAQPHDFAHGAQILRSLFGAQFPDLVESDWTAWARRAWTVQDGKLSATCDPAVAASLGTLDPAKPFPPLWPAFDALPQVPLMVIRGEYSDLLSETTVSEMQVRRPGTTSLLVRSQGHTPLLAERDTIAAISTFAARCDG